MPKPVKKAAKKRPSSDPVTRAKQLMDMHMEKVEEGQGHEYHPQSPSTQAAIQDIRALISEHMAILGAKGGKVSGAKRMEMPEAKRKAIARKGAAARWGKRDS